MNLKVRLAFLYSFSVLIILVASALYIYILNENFRKAEFTKRLNSEAAAYYSVFAAQPQLPRNLAQELDQNVNNSLPNEKVYVFDSAHRLHYSNTKQPLEISATVFKQVKQQKTYNFGQNYQQGTIAYFNKGVPAYIAVTATDVFGGRKNDNLKILLIFSVTGGIVFSSLLAFFYVKQVMKPLEKLKTQIEKISEVNLTERIEVTASNDEINQIARKFNAMLQRLESAFEQRKNFVQHASHELRTPLSNMLAQTEAALDKNLEKEEYRNILLSLKEDQQNMIDLTNSLLTLSRYEKITSFKDWSRIRIDEVVFQSVEALNQVWPTATVSVDYKSVPEKEDYLTVNGNESLIKSAIQNLIKNGLQYSENLKVTVTIDADESGVTLHFENKGKQLSLKEQQHLFIPFFRGENAQYKKGYGLGLSIVQRIMNLHKGLIQYRAVAENINRFTVFLPCA